LLLRAPYRDRSKHLDPPNPEIVFRYDEAGLVAGRRIAS
jgi:hypothetical protein